MYEYRDGSLCSRKTGRPVGSRNSTGAFNVQIRGRNYKLHRLVFLYHHGYLPPLVDHIDRDRSNNSIENLRELTIRENAINCTFHRGSVPFRGVQFRKRVGKFQSFFGKKYLGTFETAEEASDAYNKYVDETFPNIIRRE